MSARLLWLTPELHQQVTQHAASDAPNEACGVLIGHIDQGVARTVQAMPIENIAINARNAYRMDDKRLAQIIGGLEKTGMELVGFYHSHPDGEPVPSPSDIRLAAYPDIPYLIIGLRNRSSIAAWQINKGSVERIEIAVSETQPEPPAEPLSSAQKWAILLSSIAALIFVIVLALMLLPPAPEIP